MDASQQTIMLPAGHDITLNIGLSMGAFPSRLTVPHRLRVWTKVLPQLLLPGYIAELHLTPSRVWKGEPMLVVQGTFNPEVADHMLLWEAVVESEQDCIAVYVHHDIYTLNGNCAGMLFGPRADAWGEFNVNFFYFIGDKHE